MRGYTRFLLLLCIVCLTAYCAHSARSRNLRESFDKLETNRRVYNDYNERIRHPQTSGQWVNTFLERSGINNAIYTENAELIRSIKEHFINGCATDSDYRQLVECITDMREHRLGDPFLLEDLIGLLLPRLEQGRFDTFTSASIYQIYASILHEISKLGDLSSRKSAYSFYRRAIATADSLPSSQMQPAVAAMSDLLGTEWNAYGFASYDDSQDIISRLDKLLSNKEVTDALPADLDELARRQRSDFRIRFIHDVYLKKPDVLAASTADSMIDAQIEEYREFSNPSLRDVCAFNMLQAHRGYISVDSALNACMRFYNENFTMPDLILSAHIHNIGRPLADMVLLNDRSSLPADRKHDNAVFLCGQIVKLFSALCDDQSNYTYIHMLMDFLRNPALTSYLSFREKLNLIDSLMVRTQVATLAHSTHVAVLAQVICRSVEKYRPDLLPPDSLRGDYTWPEFIYQASLYHDLGKCTIEPVVTNEFRPLTEHETHFIRRHPDYGVSLQKIDSAFAIFHDTTLGHHKWYDGIGGYPRSFDNTASPVKIMIDILTIADCLEAATDLIGRNYAPTWHYDFMINEFRRQAGTRYNPELIDMIISNPEIGAELSDIVDNQWKDIYFGIYERFFTDTTPSAHR